MAGLDPRITFAFAICDLVIFFAEVIKCSGFGPRMANDRQSSNQDNSAGLWASGDSAMNQPESWNQAGLRARWLAWAVGHSLPEHEPDDTLKQPHSHKSFFHGQPPFGRGYEALSHPMEERKCLVATPSRYSVSPLFQSVERLTGATSADWKTSVQQVANLDFFGCDPTVR